MASHRLKDKSLAFGEARGLHFFYDERNLPIRIGNTTYRYTASGHRYLMQTGPSKTFQIMDGTLLLGGFQTNATGAREF